MEYKLPKMPQRIQNSNKGTFGKVLNIAGSKYMPGAAYLSSVSALRTGSGYVELVSNEETLYTVSKLAPEIVLAPLNKLQDIIDDFTVISIGCGLSTTNSATEIFKQTLKKRTSQPLIIDADGLNILSELETKLDKQTILTPHPKEAARLLNCNLEVILADTETAAKDIANKYNCISILKTYKTVVTDGKTLYHNNTGCSALAKAGSGDVLCGIIAGLLAQGLSPFDSSALAVYLHGLTGEIAAKDLTEYSVLASDLVRYIPLAINNYLNSQNI